MQSSMETYTLNTVNCNIYNQDMQHYAQRRGGGRGGQGGYLTAMKNATS